MVNPLLFRVSLRFGLYSSLAGLPDVFIWRSKMRLISSKHEKPSKRVFRAPDQARQFFVVQDDDSLLTLFKSLARPKRALEDAARWDDIPRFPGDG